MATVIFSIINTEGITEYEETDFLGFICLQGLDMEAGT